MSKIRINGRKCKAALPLPFPLACTGGGQPAELFLSPRHVLPERLRCLQAGISDSRYRAAGIHIALPVTAGDDAAFPGKPGPGEDGFGRDRINLSHQQGARPCADGVSGGIGPLPGQPLVVLRENGRFLEIGKRTNADLVCLGPETDVLDGGHAPGKPLINGRRTFF